MNNSAQAIIDAHPKACYRTLATKLAQAGLLSDHEQLLSAARPNCGYACDGEDDAPGCPVSGRAEP